MAGATRPKRRALEHWLLVLWKKEVAMVTQQELTLKPRTQTVIQAFVGAVASY